MSLLSDPFHGSSSLLILQGPEAVAAALAGCKILKEMARLESEAESARSMKEAKYEQFALGECKEEEKNQKLKPHTQTHTKLNDSS